MSGLSSPRVSVVVPVWNAAATLAETLRSALGQSLRDIEILIIDDGGTDASMTIARSFQDPRIRILSQPNKGLNGARNAGLRAARGEFVAFLDADDLWEPQMLARHLAHFEGRPDLGVSYSPSLLIDAAGRPLGLSQRPKLTGVTKGDVIRRNPIGNGSAGVFRRVVFDAVAFRRAETPPGEVWWFDETFRQSTDIECWMRIAALSDWVFEGLPETLTRYRVAQGLSSNVARQLEEWERALAALAAAAPDLAAAHGAAARAFQYRYLARRLLSQGEGRAALAMMRRALAEHPWALLGEPVKTLSTLAFSLALSVAPRPMLQKIMGVFFLIRRNFS